MVGVGFGILVLPLVDGCAVVSFDNFRNIGVVNFVPPSISSVHRVVTLFLQLYFHPANIYPIFGVATSVILLSRGSCATQRTPHSISFVHFFNISVVEVTVPKLFRSTYIVLELSDGTSAQAGCPTMAIPTHNMLTIHHVAFMRGLI